MRDKVQWLGAIVTALALTLTTASSAEPTSSDSKVEGAAFDELLTSIATARKNTKSLRASFTQERKITLLATTVRSKGELLAALPDRLRWDLAPPDDIVYFVGPEGLAYKTKSSSASVPASGAKVGRALGDLRALLTGDLARLRDRYVLEGFKDAATGQVEIRGTLKPTDGAGGVRAFALVLDKGLVIPLRARLVEGKNDSVELTFTNVVVNGPVNAASLRP